MPTKFLVIRFSSIGDIVLTSPVIRCLKTQIPNSRVHVLTKTGFSQIIEPNPYVDSIHSYDGDMQSLIGELKAENFDHIIDLHKNFRSYRIRLALGKPVTSFPKLNLKKYLLVRFRINLMPDLHLVDRYFEAVKKLGITNDEKGLDYFIPEAEQVIPYDYCPDAVKGYYAIVVGGKHNTKIYPVEKLVETCRLIEKPMFLLGGIEDFKRADEVTKAFQGKVINLCGKLGLHQSASVISQSDAVLTNDTGLMHIAAALGKPIVSIWGNTVPDLGMYPYFPGDPARSVVIENNKLTCRPCSKIGFDKCPKGHFKCMLDIDARKVANELQNLS